MGLVSGSHVLAGVDRIHCLANNVPMRLEGAGHISNRYLAVVNGFDVRVHQECNFRTNMKLHFSSGSEDVFSNTIVLNKETHGSLKSVSVGTLSGIKITCSLE